MWTWAPRVRNRDESGQCAEADFYWDSSGALMAENFFSVLVLRGGGADNDVAMGGGDAMEVDATARQPGRMVIFPAPGSSLPDPERERE